MSGVARPDFRLWWEALCGIPRVAPDRWDQLDPISRWLVASRAAVLVMTLMAAVIAGLLALWVGRFDGLRFVLVCIGLLMAHAANNILNDLSDHKRGIDEGNYFRKRYGTQPVAEGMMTARDSARMALLTVLPGVLAGIWLCWLVGLGLLPFFVIGMVLVGAYNWPLKHFGLGEPTVVLVWGPLMIGGGYLAITGTWSWAVAAASIPYALGPTTVLFGKHTDKLPFDRKKKVRTLPVLIGERASRLAVLGMIAAQYLITGGLVVMGWLAWPVLIVVAALPFLRQLVPAFAGPVPAERPSDFPDDVWPLWYSAYAFVHCRRFGVLYVVGLVLQLSLD